MKTESNIRPQTVERYPGLVRINYDVREKVNANIDVDVDVDTDVKMYEYRMVEIRGDVPAYDALTELLVTDKYPTAVLLTLLSDSSAAELEAFRQFRFLCKQVAAETPRDGDRGHRRPYRRKDPHRLPVDGISKWS